MCDQFYDSPKEGAWKSGRFSAEVGLSGLYKVFVVISTPTFLIKRASRVLATFYSPTEVKVIDSSDDSMLVHFSKLPVKNEYLEYRIAGWKRLWKYVVVKIYPFEQQDLLLREMICSKFKSDGVDSFSVPK